MVKVNSYTIERLATTLCHINYFKCPSYYCIPWRERCNGFWNCPGGIDELSCNRTSCPQQYRCSNSTLCIAIADICNKFSDCPLKDDEMFCFLKNMTCFPKCTCRLYSISCIGNTSAMFLSRDSPYVAVELQHSSQNNILELFLQVYQLVILIISQNMIIDICEMVMHSQVSRWNSSLYLIDISQNAIKSILPNCFRDMHSLRSLDIRINMVDSVADNAFKKLDKVNYLNLAHNNINILNQKSFFGLKNLLVLNLLGNRLLTVYKHTFKDNMQIKTVITTSYKICCIKPNTETWCNVKPSWPNSCDRLLDDTAVRIIIWTVGTIGLLLNVSSLNYKNPAYSKDIGTCYKIVVSAISFGDLLMCISLLIIVSSDAAIGDRYLTHESSWRQNPLCFSVATLTISSNLISVYTLHVMALSRYFVLTNTMNSKFTSVSFTCYILMIGICVSVLLSISLVMFYRFIDTGHSIETGLCLLIGYKQKSIVLFLVIVITVLSQGITIFTIPGIYIALHLFLVKQKQEMKDSKAGDRSKGIRKSLLASLSNLFCWVPSAILLLLTLIWKRYPHKILIWMCAIVLPFNALLNPLILVYLNPLIQLFRKLGTHAQTLSACQIFNRYREKPEEYICRPDQFEAPASTTAIVATTSPSASAVTTGSTSEPPLGVIREQGE